MSGSVLTGDLRAFLVAAKRQTYAAGSAAASVIAELPGSKQLEYASGRFRYRDLYIGMSFFVGLETVAQDGAALWAMSYAGGVEAQAAAACQTKAVYGFLREALSRVAEDLPYRGPDCHENDEFTYLNRAEGTLSSFRGCERILRGKRDVYRLDYAGGLTQ